MRGAEPIVERPVGVARGLANLYVIGVRIEDQDCASQVADKRFQQTAHHEAFASTGLGEDRGVPP
jgi:hypothetical protein